LSYKQIRVALCPANLLQQSSLSEIPEISTARALDKVDGELEQANFPRVIDSLNHCAKRLVFVFDEAPGAIDHRIDRIAQRFLGHLRFAKLKSVSEDSDVVQPLSQLIDIALRFFAKSFQQQP
jgi:hypothetical protein